MKYTPAAYAKALMAFITAFGGAAATSAPHDAVGWAGCVGAGLVALAAVFATPNKSADSTSAADVIVNNIPVVVQQAQQAQDDLEKIRQAASDALSQVPVLGPVATQVLNSLPRL